MKGLPDKLNPCDCLYAREHTKPCGHIMFCPQSDFKTKGRTERNRSLWS
jgi:hypothetical protein